MLLLRNFTVKNKTFIYSKLESLPESRHMEIFKKSSIAPNNSVSMGQFLGDVITLRRFKEPFDSFKKRVDTSLLHFEVATLFIVGLYYLLIFKQKF